MSLVQFLFGRRLVLFSVLAIICSLTFGAGEEPSANRLEVKIYYEALCSDSMIFITRQLRPSMIEKNRWDFADIKFVPYGHVFFYFDPATNEKVLLCQHGKQECKLNSEHACIIENNTEREAFDMISCLMVAPTFNIDKCGRKLGVDLTAAKKCARERKLVDILEKYGNETYKLAPSFVPAISIDEVYDWDEQPEILSNFDKVFCNKYKTKFNITLAGC